MVGRRKKRMRRWPWPVLIVQTPMPSKAWCQNHQDEFAFDYAVLAPRKAVVWPLGGPGCPLDDLERHLQRQDISAVRHDGGYTESEEVAGHRKRSPTIHVRRMWVREKVKSQTVF